MATNTSTLKTFAQQTRIKLISLISTKMQFVLNADTAELRGYEREIAKLRNRITEKGTSAVVEEVAYTWFNRIMALRYMDANGYNAPMVVSPAAGQTRPEILQNAMGGGIEDDLMLTAEERLLPEPKLYRRLLVAVCNRQKSASMPFLFEHISDYTELLLPDDLLSDQSFVSDIRKGMTDEDCQNVELMGWLYQFYITDRKADAEVKKSKKGGLKSDEQAAATQLFTPHWIVRYMVENSLGRIWMVLHPESRLIESMPYYISTPEGQTDTIPKDIHSVKDIRFIDPCMGSGHILVYAFDLFVKMYEEEGVNPREIPTLIFQNNLFGIDIDRRCYQLACFALTMKARAYDRRYLRHSVTPNLIALQKIEHDIIESAGNWSDKSLIWQFQNIDTIGSLLKVTPEECEAIRVENGLFHEQQQLLKTQAEYLSREYHCVVTNPPYLGKGFCNELKNYVQKEYPNSKADTMATFMERGLELCCCFGKCAMINMQSWMFLSSYEKLREVILNKYHIDSLLHLGPHAFDEIGGEVVQCATFVFSNGSTGLGTYCRLTNEENSSLKENAFMNRIHLYLNVNQNRFYEIPGKVIGYWVSDKLIDAFTNGMALSEIAYPRQGMATCNNGKFLKIWHEVSLNKIGFGLTSEEETNDGHKWFPYNKGGEYRKWFGNNDYVVNFANKGKEICDYIDKHSAVNHTGRVINRDKYFNPSVTWSKVSSGNIAFRYKPHGHIFDVAGTSIFGNTERLLSLMGLLNSKITNEILSCLSPTLNFEVGHISSLPIIDFEEDAINCMVKENVDISKLDWNSNETSWDFQFNPLWEQQINTVPLAMQTIETLVGKYKSYWETQFHQLHQNEEELNRKFIDIYGLQDELTPDVPLDEITILQKGEISIEDNHIVWHDDVIIKQFISWLVGCFMGRYSADKPGLVIASQGQKIGDLNLPAQTIEIDDDGIIPIVMDTDFFADDMTQRIHAAVKTLFGNKYYLENMKFIKNALGQELRDYFFKNFYADHQQMYSVKGAKRPIYWLFSSQMGEKKRKGYFKALVYMHRMESDTLSKLHADYVIPYIKKTEIQLLEAENDSSRDDLNQSQRNKALKLVEELRDKVREVKAFETSLVEMASARIAIDLDDGVKTNYPKFYPLVDYIKGLEETNED